MTVCPPKDTFTDLNYDQMLAENTTLSDKERADLLEYAIEVLEESNFMNELNKMNEVNRFMNWYKGYTQIKPPQYITGIGYQFHIHTTAPSGTVTTEFYGKQFQEDLIEDKTWYTVNIHIPESLINNKNATLHFKLEKVSMIGLGGGYESYQLGNVIVNEKQKSVSTSFNPPNENPIMLPNGFSDETIKYLQLIRVVGKTGDLKSQGDLMPGFKFSWYYTGTEVKPIGMYKVRLG